MKELTSGVKGLAMDDDMEKSENDRINILHNYIMAKLDSHADTGKTLDLSDEKAILSEAERLEIVHKVLTIKEILVPLTDLQKVL